MKGKYTPKDSDEKAAARFCCIIQENIAVCWSVSKINIYTSCPQVGRLPKNVIKLKKHYFNTFLPE